MESLPMSLTQCLEQYKMIPNHIKNSILLDVSLGLLYLHKQTPPIVHRDLTANNVLLTSGLKAKISDVGIVSIVEPQLTKQYILMMSYPNIQSYLPPEVQRQSVTISPEIDIFSFGNLILHIFTHKWPVPTDLFNEDNMALTEVQRRKYLFDEIESSNPLKQLAEHCLHNRPQSRPLTNKLVSTIQILNVEDDHIEGILGGDISVLKKELETLKELKKSLQEENTNLRQQLDLRKTLLQSEEGMLISLTYLKCLLSLKVVNM